MCYLDSSTPSTPVDPLPIELDTGLRDEPSLYRASKKPKIEDAKGS
jgi:hypothetical protein